MQKDNQTAQFIFSHINAPHDTSLPHQAQLTFSQITLGGLFIRSYKMQFKDKTHLCSTFLKRVHKQSYYLFLKFIDGDWQSIELSHLEAVRRSVDAVRKIKQIGSEEGFPYRVLLCFLGDYSSAEIENTQFEAVLKIRGVGGGEIVYQGEGPSKASETSKGTVQKMVYQKLEQFNTQPKLQQLQQDSDSECRPFMDNYQQQTIKGFIWSYLDTFGQNYKSNLYHQFQKTSSHHMSIRRILQTVHWIIYTQTVASPFNQLQSSNWTCFQAQSKQKCKSDRKEMMLTGGGSILYIPLMFICENLDHYKESCDRELFEVMQESKKYYSEGEIKAYLISDRVDAHGLGYQTTSQQLHRFSAYDKTD